MKPNSLKHFLIFVSVLALAALACKGGTPALEPVTPSNENTETSEAGTLSQATRSQLIAATVQIIALQGGDPIYVGSGTVLNPGGMILTNAHVASPTTVGAPELEPDTLVVAVVVSEDKPAVPSYIANVLAVDGFLDLAVIQIVSTVDGSTVSAGSLNLPYVDLQNSDNVHVGDNINIFGFPSIGGNTITFTQGTVSGFSSEDQIGDRAWIKTDATISGGNSGGLAADNNGNIIGVPTIAASSREAETSDCRVIQDTNSDGVVDQNDSCVPIGGFLNGIRPVNLALPLIEAAQGGKQYTSPFRTPGTVGNPGSGSESATNFIWLDTSESGSQGCKFNDTPVNDYGSSAMCIAAGFEYSGMTDGELVLERWYLNGEQAAEYSYAWEWGESGLFGTILPNDGNPMPAGNYRLELFAGDALTAMGNSNEVAVSGGGSGGQTQQPSSGDTITVYGLIYDASTNKPISGAFVFVLTPGTTYEEWQASNFNESYVNAYLETGANGQYEINGIPRDTEFTLVFAAQGYYDSYADNLIAGPNDPDLNEINVGLTK